MAKAGRKSNREKALELVAKYSATKKAVKVSAGVSLEADSYNTGKPQRRAMKNLK